MLFATSNDRLLKDCMERIRQNSPTTTRIVVCGIDISDDDVIALTQVLRSNTIVQLLEFSWTFGIGITGCQAIAEILQTNTTITSFSMIATSLDTEKVQLFASVIERNQSALTDLNLSDNKNIQFEGVISILDALVHNTTLKNVNLAYTIDSDMGVTVTPTTPPPPPPTTTTTAAVVTAQTAISEEIPSRISTLAEKYNTLLLQNKILQCLDLSGNHFDDDFITILATGLQYNTVLEQLSLSYNKIRHTGVYTLLEALKYNKAFRKLQLQGNFIDDAGAQLIAQSLRYNTNITHFNLDHNKLSHVGIYIVLQSLEYNTHLFEMNVSGMEITWDELNLLQTVLQYNDTIGKIYCELFMTPYILEILERNIQNQRVALKKGSRQRTDIYNWLLLQNDY